MRRKRTGRAALGVLTTGLALVLGVLGSGAAQASTTAADGAHVTAATADAAAAATCDGSGYCSYDTGWVSYGDGGCEVDTTVGLRQGENVMLVIVTVKSPYLFAGCTAVSTVHFGLTNGATYSSGGFWGYACSETDLSCTGMHADPGEWIYLNVSTGIPTAALSWDVDSIRVTDTT
jgi:hypothetical protein